MNIIDLELYRWNLMRLCSNNSGFTASSPSSAWRIYWQERGAFISTLPRQSGKTTMLKKMADYFINNNENYIILVPRLSMTNSMIQMGFDVHKIISEPQYHVSDPSITNLLVEEYTEFSCGYMSNELKTALTYGWKSVSMVGTFNWEY